MKITGRFTRYLKIILLVLVPLCLIFSAVNIFIVGREAGKYVNLVSPKKQQKAYYETLFNEKSNLLIQLDTTVYVDDKRILYAYHIPSLKRKLIVMQLDDSISQLPGHILIHKPADVYGGFREYKTSDRTIYTSLAHYKLEEELYVRYDGSPVKLKVAKQNLLIFQSPGLIKLSIHFHQDEQAAYKLTTERYFKKYKTEFALIRKRNKNFMVILLSEDQDDHQDGLILNSLLKL